MYPFLERAIQQTIFPANFSLGQRDIVRLLPVDGLRAYRRKAFKGDACKLLEHMSIPSGPYIGDWYCLRKYRRFGPVMLEYVLNPKLCLYREYRETGKAVTVTEHVLGGRPWTYRYEDGDRLSSIETVTTSSMSLLQKGDDRRKRHLTGHTSFSWDKSGRLVGLHRRPQPKASYYPLVDGVAVRIEYLLGGDLVLWNSSRITKTESDDGVQTQDKDIRAWLFEFKGAEAYARRFLADNPRCEFERIGLGRREYLQSLMGIHVRNSLDVENHRIGVPGDEEMASFWDTWLATIRDYELDHELIRSAIAYRNQATMGSHKSTDVESVGGQCPDVHEEDRFYV